MNYLKWNNFKSVVTFTYHLRIIKKKLKLFIINKIKEMKTSKDYIKANRKGAREAELEFQNGFTSKNKIHKSKKEYKRKPKYKEEYA